MDERPVFNKRGVNLGVPIKQEILPTNQLSFDDSWFQKRLDLVRRESLKDLRTKVVHTTKEK